MKNIYFLRHGQTKLNKLKVHQHPETPLTEVGVKQAKVIATLLKDVPFEIIISSPYERTMQTAETVNRMFGAPLERNELFAELRRPSEIQGLGWFSMKSLWVMGQIYLMAKNKLWHYSDEENLSEFKERAFLALQCLSNRPEQNILVVTHRGIMASMISTMKKDGKDSIAQNRIGLWRNLKIHNCCYFTAKWTKEGKSDDGLNGTWTLEKGTTCPM